MPINEITPKIDGASVIVGGIITNVRSLVTKSGSKMAFVKIEDKVNTQEVIIFPSLYEEIGSKLVTDAIVKVTGRVNAKDKDGNVTDDAKIIADTVTFLTDTTLLNYEPTGTPLPEPVAAPKKEFKRRSRVAAETIAKPTAVDSSKEEKKPAAKPTAKAAPKKTVSKPKAEPVKTEEPHRVATQPKDPRDEKVYVLIEDVTNNELLTKIRQLSDQNKGVQDIILVTKDESGKHPLKMPFKVEACKLFIDELKNLVGDEHVIVK